MADGVRFCKEELGKKLGNMDRHGVAYLRQQEQDAGTTERCLMRSRKKQVPRLRGSSRKERAKEKTTGHLGRDDSFFVAYPEQKPQEAGIVRTGAQHVVVPLPRKIDTTAGRVVSLGQASVGGKTDEGQAWGENGGAEPMAEEHGEGIARKRGTARMRGHQREANGPFPHISD
jgi:hypothetical protein